PEVQATIVAQRGCGLDDLVDGRGLGQRDQQHLSAARVGQQLADVDRLAVDGAAAHQLQQVGGCHQERNCVPGGRAVDHDQVVVAALFELLDLAEHHDVVDA